MKLFESALIILALLLSMSANGSADRLYTWTDAKGVTHITQDPPPDTAKTIDTLDYSPQLNQTTRRSTEIDQMDRQQGSSNQGERGSQSGALSGFASGEEDKNVQHEGDSYRRTLLRYGIKHKLLDNDESGKKGEPPAGVQPHFRRR